MTPAALGFRAHTGWAAMVALAGEPAHPSVVDRRRVELISAQVDAAVYHAARERDLIVAQQMVARAVEEARLRARSAISGLMDEMAASGRRVVGVGVVTGAASLPTHLEKILASHALVHAAEGQLFRDALVAGAEMCGLAVAAIAADRLYVESGAALHLDDAEVARRLAALGKAAGRPWAQDQKEAALVAWQALARHSPDAKPGRA